VGQEVHRNFTMGLATLSPHLGRRSIESAIDTGSAAIRRQRQRAPGRDLAINGRRFQLYLMTPGAVNFGGGTFDDIRFNGRSFEENALRFDGIEAGGIISNNRATSAAKWAACSGCKPAWKNVQEFRVDSSNYRRSLAREAAGRSAHHQSGSNAFHGSLFEYFERCAGRAQ